MESWEKEKRNDAIVTNDISSFDVVRLLATTVLIPIKKLGIYSLLLLCDPIDIRSHVLHIRRFVINRGDRGWVLRQFLPYIGNFYLVPQDVQHARQPWKYHPHN